MDVLLITVAGPRRTLTDFPIKPQRAPIPSIYNFYSLSDYHFITKPLFCQVLQKVLST